MNRRSSEVKYYLMVSDGSLNILKATDSKIFMTALHGIILLFVQ